MIYFYKAVHTRPGTPIPKVRLCRDKQYNFLKATMTLFWLHQKLQHDKKSRQRKTGRPDKSLFSEMDASNSLFSGCQSPHLVKGPVICFLLRWLNWSFGMFVLGWESNEWGASAFATSLSVCCQVCMSDWSCEWLVAFAFIFWRREIRRRDFGDK